MDSTSDKIGRYVAAEDVISADGTERNIIIINGQFPGPTIEVIEGAKVIVHVENNLETEPLTIHWHGMYQKGTPWMDGAAYISQCPILPRQSFTYSFTADPPGTHWYHTHYMSQRLDGLYGALLVHLSPPTLTYYPVIVTEWYPVTGATWALNNPYRGGSGFGYLPVRNRDYSVDGHEIGFPMFHSALINGRGRVFSVEGQESDNLPKTIFEVPNNSEVEFRLIGAGGDYSFEISVDDHQLSVVSSDGHTVVPMTVDSVIVTPGERYDVRILTNKPPSSYWMRARTLRHALGPDSESDGIIKETLAIVKYDNSDADMEPTTQAKTCTPSAPCTVLNCPYPIYPPSHVCVSVAQLQSVGYTQEFLQDKYGLDVDLDDVTDYFFNYAFLIGSSVNSRMSKYPRAPMFMGDDYIEPCDKEQCDENGCICTYIEELASGSTVHFVISSLEPGNRYLAPHAIHLHGHSFAVLKVGYFTPNETTGRVDSPNEDLECKNQKCTSIGWRDGNRPELNLEDPPLKDSLVVPPHGYAIVRFRTDNPGYWFFHCHQETHLSEGMGLIIKEGEVPNPPKNFPTCGDFTTDEHETESVDPSTVSTISPDKPEPTKKSTKSEDTNAVNDKQTGVQDGYLVLEFGAAVGIMFGLILCGAVLAVCPLLTYVACRARNKGSKD